MVSFIIYRQSPTRLSSESFVRAGAQSTRPPGVYSSSRTREFRAMACTCTAPATCPTVPLYLLVGRGEACGRCGVVVVTYASLPPKSPVVSVVSGAWRGRRRRDYEIAPLPLPFVSSPRGIGMGGAIFRSSCAVSGISGAADGELERGGGTRPRPRTARTE